MLLFGHDRKRSGAAGADSRTARIGRNLSEPIGTLGGLGKPLPGAGGGSPRPAGPRWGVPGSPVRAKISKVGVCPFLTLRLRASVGKPRQGVMVAALAQLYLTSLVLFAAREARAASGSAWRLGFRV